MTRFRFQEMSASVPGTWGVPLPVVHCRRCGEVPMPEESLPVFLSGTGAQEAAGKGPGEGSRDVRPPPADRGKTSSPLPATCPLCSGEAVRDSQVIVPWIGEALACFVSALKLQRQALEPTIASPEPVPAPPAPPAPPAGETPAEVPVVSERTPSTECQPLSTGEDSGKGESAEKPLDLIPEVPFPEEEVREGEAAKAQTLGGEPAIKEEVLPEDRDPFLEVPHQEVSGEAGLDSWEEEPGAPLRVETPSAEPESQATPPSTEVDEEEEEDDGEAAKPSVLESRFHPFRSETVRRWLPVDAVFGRHDQGVIFLLIARALTKFLNEIGEIPFQEPFYRYLRMGKIEFAPAPDQRPPGARGKPETVKKGPERVERSVPPGEKREAPGSQPERIAPAISPQEAIERFGADALRIALIRPCPPHRPATLGEHDLHCAQRFLRQIYDQLTVRLEKGKFVSRAVLEAKHRMIHSTTQRLKRFKFHTAVASVQEFLNFLKSPSTTQEEMDRNAIRTFLIVLWPFAPHLAEELWDRIGETGGIRGEAWPEANKELLRSPEREVPVRIDGHLCQRLKVPGGLDREKLEAQALRDEKVQKAVRGRPIRKVIAVADRVVNILLEAEAPPGASPQETAKGESQMPPASPPGETAPKPGTLERSQTPAEGPTNSTRTSPKSA